MMSWSALLVAKRFLIVFIRERVTRGSCRKGIVLCKTNFMRSFGDIPLQNRLKRWSKYITGAVLLVAVAVLVGWEFDIDYLKSLLSGIERNEPGGRSGIYFFRFFFSFTYFHSLFQNQNRLLASCSHRLFC